jgi:hypothetical protein
MNMKKKMMDDVVNGSVHVYLNEQGDGRSHCLDPSGVIT